MASLACQWKAHVEDSHQRTIRHCDMSNQGMQGASHKLVIIGTAINGIATARNIMIASALKTTPRSIFLHEDVGTTKPSVQDTWLQLGMCSGYAGLVFGVGIRLESGC